jgi:hypothetical protein
MFLHLLWKPVRKKRQRERIDEVFGVVRMKIEWALQMLYSLDAGYTA